MFCLIEPPNPASHFTGDIWVLSLRLILKQVTALPRGVALGKKASCPASSYVITHEAKHEANESSYLVDQIKVPASWNY